MAKQRSTMELLRYLSIMGPGLVPAIKTGNFDGAAWGAAVAAADAKNFDQILADIGAQAAVGDAAFFTPTASTDCGLGRLEITDTVTPPSTRISSPVM